MSRNKVGSVSKPYYEIHDSSEDLSLELTLKEAYEVAKSNGYQSTKAGFKDLFYKHRGEVGYSAWGIARVKLEGKNKYFYKVVDRE